MNAPLARSVPPIWAWGLRLAAAPTFAVMAAVTSTGPPAVMICSAGHAPLLSGMTPMYLLMSLFHSGPWLTLLARRTKMGLAA